MRNAGLPTPVPGRAAGGHQNIRIDIRNSRETDARRAIGPFVSDDPRRNSTGIGAFWIRQGFVGPEEARTRLAVGSGYTAARGVALAEAARRITSY